MYKQSDNYEFSGSDTVLVKEATCSDCPQAVLRMVVYWDDGTEDVEF
jgi:hypothetical protein